MIVVATVLLADATMFAALVADALVVSDEVVLSVVSEGLVASDVVKTSGIWPVSDTLIWAVAAVFARVIVSADASVTVVEMILVVDCSVLAGYPEDFSGRYMPHALSRVTVEIRNSKKNLRCMKDSSLFQIEYQTNSRERIHEEIMS